MRVSLVIRNFVVAVVAVLVLAVGAETRAQDASAPLESRYQLVGGSAGSYAFTVDPGATRLWVDIRQGASTDTFAITTPSGMPLDGTRTEVLASKADRNTKSDPLGQFQDELFVDEPEAGTYVLDATADVFGLVIVEGAAKLQVWVDGIGPDGIIPTRTAITVSALLSAADDALLSDATLTGTLVLTSEADGKAAETPWSTTLDFVPGEKPGVYTATLANGIKSGGVYTLSVTGAAGLVRRDLTTSLAVWSGFGTPKLADATEAPTLTETLDDGAAAKTDAAESGKGDEAAPSTASPDKRSAHVGEIFYAREDLADPAKPVILFLHGWNSNTNIWDDRGDGFYGNAIDAAYRVALLGMYPDRGIETNAALISAALPLITAHYDVKKLVVVAHSKGGVDADAGIVLAGNTQYASTIMTLGTPHTGTPLADLADDPRFSGLSELADLRNEAQRAMKPAAMALFRYQVRNNPNNAFVDIRTFGGWDYENVRHFDDLVLLTLGRILHTFGGERYNDGIVPYASSRRPGPGGQEIFSGFADSRTKFNHFQLHERPLYWGHIQAQLLTSIWDNTPSAPSDLVATAVPDAIPNSAVTLTWNSQARFAQTVKIERATDGGPFEEILSTSAQYPVFYDYGVSVPHSYAYRLRFGIAERWFSGYSNVATATFAAPLPAAPSNLRLSVLNSSALRLNWNDNSPNETGFEIHRQAPSGSWTRIATVGAGVTTFLNNGLTPTTAYAYKVRAVNGSGVSDFSNTASATTAQETLSAPTNVTAVYNGGTRRIVLGWTDTTVTETGFQLQMSYAGSAFTDMVPATVGANVVTATTAANIPTGTYQFRIRAIRGADVSPWSALASATVTSATATPARTATPTRTATPAPTATPVAPAAPSNLAAGYSGATQQVTLTWSDNSGNEDAFQVQFSYSGSAFGDLAPATVGVNVTTRVIGPNMPTGSYQYRVRALRGTAASAWSNVASVIVSPPPGPAIAAPSHLTAYYSTSARTIQLWWADHSSDETAFHAQFSFNGSAFADLAPATVGANVTTYVTGANVPLGSYQFRVRALRGSDVSEWSNVGSTLAR